MNLRDICKVARSLHETGGGLICRADFIAACAKSSDQEAKKILLSEGIFSDMGLEKKVANAKISVFLPSLLSVVHNNGHEVKITRKPQKDTQAMDSAYYARGFIWNPEDLKGAHEIVCYYSTYCWMRFVIVKELMHLYSGLFDSITDVAGMVNDSKLSLMRRCVREIHNAIPDINKDLDNETSAFYLAIEYLLPWAQRKAIESILDFNMQAYGRIGSYISAKTFFVPEYIIMHVLQKDHCMMGLNYLNLSNVVNEGLEKEASALATLQ